ncbi:unnamed protein product, partial [Brassica oleracea var. botrytis]
MNEAAVAGESGLEVYTVSHNLLLAHAEAIGVFRNNPKCKDGKIGIAHCPVWFEPFDMNCPDDKEACERAMEFMFGWEKITLIYLSTIQKAPGIFDFVGVNYYSGFYVKSIAEVDHNTPKWRSDARIEWRKQNKAGQTLGVRSACPKFMITENGHCDMDYEEKTKLSNLMDLQRTEYHKKHLQSIQQAIQLSFLLMINDFFFLLREDGNELKRFPKISAMWFKEFLKRAEEIEESEKEEYLLKSAMKKRRFL